MTENNFHNADTHIKDAWLQGKIATAFSVNNHLCNFEIDVQVKDQSVYLSGVVKSAVDKRLAQEVSFQADGIVGVINDIEVSPEYPIDTNNQHKELNGWINDSTITASVKSEFFCNSEISKSKIGVNTRKGIVTLTGSVGSTEELKLAEKLAHEVNGGVQIENELLIEPLRKKQ